MEAPDNNLNITVLVDGKEKNSLKIGDVFTISVSASIDGYLHIFNIGTAGFVTKVIPSAELCDLPPRIKSNIPFLIPGDISADLFPDKGWVENGPSTAETGRSEKIVAIVTSENADISPDCLSDSARGAFATVHETVHSLDNLTCLWIKGEISLKIFEADTTQS